MQRFTIHPPLPRVLHVITPSRMAGAETFLARLLRHASAEWEQIACAVEPALARSTRTAEPRPQRRLHCVASRRPTATELRAAGVPCEPLGIGGKANLLAMPRLAAAAKRFRADLLHSHLSTASWWCGWLEQFGGPPSIGHVHGFTSRRWHIRQSHLIACSQAVRNDLIAKGIPADRVTVMHYPVAPDDVRASRKPLDVRAELGAAADTPIVGTFAHLSLKKGYRELIRAAEIVLRRMPAAQFWCFGEGPLRAELERHAQAAGIADRFRLFGFRRDVPDLMRAIDVMCLPSHREPFGLVYVEAALAERPVIACNAGGATEIIEDGVTGWLVPPPGLRLSATGSRIESGSQAAAGGNIAALTDAILAALSDRSNAVAMGRRGRQMALDRFGWPVYLAELNNLYARVLGVVAGRNRPAAELAA
jgi:glycosyltransferase involved in cell wall biosynthesis